MQDNNRRRVSPDPLQAIRDEIDRQYGGAGLGDASLAEVHPSPAPSVPGYAAPNEGIQEHITADGIRRKDFTTRRMRGVAHEEVSDYLQQVADAYAALEETNASQSTRILALERKVSASAAREKDLVEALAAAHQLGAQIRSDAEQEARRPTSEGEARAQSVIKAADEREASIIENFDVLRSGVVQELDGLLQGAQARAQALLEGAKEREAATSTEIEVLKRQAEMEAERLVVDARATAEALIIEATEREAALRSDLEALTGRRLEIVQDIRTVMDKHRQWIAAMDPEVEARKQIPGN
jgi:DivIVA domain-containing protein